MNGELHWNDAKEGLPPMRTVVWVTTEGGYVYLAQRQDDRWARADEPTASVVNVNAWAHLPRPKAPMRQCLWIGDGYEEA